MMTHAEARAILESIWEDTTGEKPTLPELQFAGAIGAFEGNYGSAWGNANNWGAIHASHGGPGTVEIVEHHRDGTPYTQAMVVYPTPEAGAAAMVRLITVRRPSVWKGMKAGDAFRAVKGMTERDPETGVGVYAEADPKKYLVAVKRHSIAIAKAVDNGRIALRFGGNGGSMVVVVGGLAGLAWLISRRL